ncbi:preprotein translocase subunit YajC [Anaeroselena agilis]|uniref:Preprotein translocase subunit YajC n=1 Tax=Anaeroselena agilis TaxID=3063788 RepID=A0ABU3NW39_9FIRM|nr:preprotein translocase subunit YajC [Selenomonadales bacterium 4137-cl]
MEFLSPEILQWAPFIIMIVIFYFLFYRPQKKEQKKRSDMLGSMKKGDRVVTIGGIHGTITGFSDDTVTIRVAEKVELDFNRAAVASVKNKAE